jgi:hypothetical protein
MAAPRIRFNWKENTRTFDCRGRITSLGNNIISDVTGCDVVTAKRSDR